VVLLSRGRSDTTGKKDQLLLVIWKGNDVLLQQRYLILHVLLLGPIGRGPGSRLAEPVPTQQWAWMLDNACVVTVYVFPFVVAGAFISAMHTNAVCTGSADNVALPIRGRWFPPPSLWKSGPQSYPPRRCIAASSARHAHGPPHWPKGQLTSRRAKGRFSRPNGADVLVSHNSAR
jgi:hypothetical protein